jgi:hypothetical protein
VFFSEPVFFCFVSGRSSEILSEGEHVLFTVVTLKGQYEVSVQ